MTKKTKKKNTKNKIKDPPFGKTLHKGTIATKGSIFYGYQDYDNIMDTIELFLSEKKEYQIMFNYLKKSK